MEGAAQDHGLQLGSLALSRRSTADSEDDDDDDDVSPHLLSRSASQEQLYRPGTTHNRVGCLDETSLLVSRTAFLDGLRGVAAFLVYMHHQTALFYGLETDVDRGYGSNDHEHDNRPTYYFASLPFLRLLYSGGNAMVAIFFVLSGYVLSRSFLISLKQSATGITATTINAQSTDLYRRLIGAAIRRPFRLYLPPVGVALAYALAMHLPFGLAVRTQVPAPQPSLLLELWNCVPELVKFLNPLQEHGFYKLWFSYNPVLWTIPVELKGSALVYCLIAFLNATSRTRFKRYHVTLLWSLVVLLILVYQWTMAMFVAGIVLCIHDLNNDMNGNGNYKISSANSSPALPLPPSLSRPQQSSLLSSLQTSRPFLRLTSMLRSDRFNGSKALLVSELLIGTYFLTQPSRVKYPQRGEGTFGWGILTRYLTPQNYHQNEFWRFYQSIGSIMLLHSLLSLQFVIPQIPKFFERETFLFLGKISFSLYLVHVPLLLTWGDTIQRALGVPPRNWKESAFSTDNLLAWVVPDFGVVGLSIRFLVALALILPLVLGAAVLATKSLDLPSVKVGKIVCRRFGY